MELRIYKNQYGYSTLCKNGETKIYMPITFKKGNEPQGEKIDVKITNGFFSNYTDKNGLVKPKLVIMAYEVTAQDLPSDVKIVNEPPAETFGSDLPF